MNLSGNDVKLHFIVPMKKKFGRNAIILGKWRYFNSLI